MCFALSASWDLSARYAMHENDTKMAACEQRESLLRLRNRVHSGWVRESIEDVAVTRLDRTILGDAVVLRQLMLFYSHTQISSVDEDTRMNL